MWRRVNTRLFIERIFVLLLFLSFFIPLLLDELEELDETEDLNPECLFTLILMADPGIFLLYRVKLEVGLLSQTIVILIKYFDKYKVFVKPTILSRTKSFNTIGECRRMLVLQSLPTKPFCPKRNRTRPGGKHLAFF